MRFRGVHANPDRFSVAIEDGSKVIGLVVTESESASLVVHLAWCLLLEGLEVGFSIYSAEYPTHEVFLMGASKILQIKRIPQWPLSTVLSLCRLVNRSSYASYCNLYSMDCQGGGRRYGDEKFIE